MTSNYINHLRYELFDLRSKESEAASRSRSLEVQWARSTARRKQCQNLLEQLFSEEDQNKGKFRESHAYHSGIRTEIAEIEEELLDLGTGFGTLN